ncbi:hypothetical protein KEM55_002757, partial [Ascosphaera atra]
PTSMNNIRQIQALNKRELEKAVPPSASWHADYRDTAYIYIGGLPFDLTEGDIITIFSQYGEPVHLNLVRDKETGKSRGFAFLKYEDQRSTDLAVDNLGGATVLGRMLRVDHVRYKRREEEGLEDNLVEQAKEEEGEEDGRSSRSRSPVREKKRRPLLKEEKELHDIIDNHDEEDPMKEYLIEQKKEELSKALAQPERKKTDETEAGTDIVVTKRTPRDIVIHIIAIGAIDTIPDAKIAGVQGVKGNERGTTHIAAEGGLHHNRVRGLLRRVLRAHLQNYLSENTEDERDMAMRTREKEEGVESGFDMP